MPPSPATATATATAASSSSPTTTRTPPSPTTTAAASSSPTTTRTPPSPTTTASTSPFSLLSDDLLLLILSKLSSEPHHFPRLCCVSRRFSSLIQSSCYPSLLLPLPPSLLPLPQSSLLKLSFCCPGPLLAGVPLPPDPSPHLSRTPWSPSREEGAKLLSSRFRDDRLYVSAWPACPHRSQDGRNYMIFRGVFPEFARSALRRAIAGAAMVPLRCAFCSCDRTWDLHALFCMRRAFECHGDGEPAVRAYVCENGHVAGAWTERPRYT